MSEPQLARRVRPGYTRVPHKEADRLAADETYSLTPWILNAKGIVAANQMLNQKTRALPYAESRLVCLGAWQVGEPSPLAKQPP